MNTVRAASLTVADLLHKRARSQPDAPALSDGATNLSYAQLDARVRRLAGALRAAWQRRAPKRLLRPT